MGQSYNKADRYFNMPIFERGFSCVLTIKNSHGEKTAPDITCYLGVGADCASTRHAGVGAELVKASHADLFLVFPHKLLSTEVLATVKTVGTGGHSQ